MDEFLQAFHQSLEKGTFVSLILSQPTGSSIENDVRKMSVRSVEVRGQQQYQWTSHLSRQESHENLDLADSVDRVATLLGTQFRHAHLYSTDSDRSVRFNKKGRCRMTVRPPTKHQSANSSHDRSKQYLIPEGRPCAFLHELGVMTADGKVHRAKQAKFRQINRFLEFVEDIIPHLPQEDPIEVVDFGCGLSYLTFALHYLLSVVHEREVSVLGIDENPHVIARCNDMVRRLELEGLTFENRSIMAVKEESKVHLAVALHACDTATDDALVQAVLRLADVILAAPCCQHELSPQLNGDALGLITQHGILRERFAAMATDALRVAALEDAGYRTQIVEFIETEHTPKNLLIRAVRRPDQSSPLQITKRISHLKSLLGIEHQRLLERLAEMSSSSR